MTVASRDLVLQTLECRGPQRAPRHLWVLPWAEMHHPDELAAIRADYPDDIVWTDMVLKEEPKTTGDPFLPGKYVDPWGSVFENIQPGVIGEVKEPLVRDWNADREKIHVPREWLTLESEVVDRLCGDIDQFVLSGCCPRPFEQLQFLRGTAELYVDLMTEEPGMLSFLKEMHAFYCELMELWAQTEVDGLTFMDDWGSQNSLLIDPEVWRRHFKPLYRDYIDIAHGAGKKAFMHSDGHTLSIFPDLVELGLDAINSQVFCMGPEALSAFAGKITFWGEMDRQHMLVEATTEDIDQAVRRTHENLWREGGCIAQCEFGPGAKPENVRQVYASWDAVTQAPA